MVVICEKTRHQLFTVSALHSVISSFNFLCSRIKQNGNRGSLIRFAFHSDLSVVVLNSVLYDRKTKAGSTGLLGMALIDTIEALKYLALMFGSNTDAGVANATLYSALLLSNSNLNFAAGIIVLNAATPCYCIAPVNCSDIDVKRIKCYSDGV